jgi:hypothetical protein
MAYEILNHDYLAGHSNECLQRALEVVAQRWPEISPRRWEFALERAFAEVYRREAKSNDDEEFDIHDFEDAA